MPFLSDIVKTVGGNQGYQGFQGEAGVGAGDLVIVSYTDVTHTLVLSDNGKLLRMNNVLDIEITVPTNGDVAFPIGAVLSIEQQGLGQVSVVGDTGVVINYYNGNKSAGQYAGLQIYKVGTDTWTLIGGVA
jgi:hypothetical protein